MAISPANSRQIPDHAILDLNNKQAYLGNAYLATSGAVTLTTAATEYNVISLINPVANGLAANYNKGIGCFQYIRNVMQSTNQLTATTLFKIYINPTTIASGTDLTPFNLRPLMGAAPNLSAMTAKSAPTDVTRGTLIQSIGTANLMVSSLIPIILDPGTSLLVTATSDTNGTKVICELAWYEL